MNTNTSLSPRQMDQTNLTLSKGGGSGELGHTKLYQ